MKMLVTPQGRKYLYRGEDIHTQYGFVPKKSIDNAKPGSTLKTNTGKEMLVTNAGFLDIYRRMKRSAQIIPLKDVSAVVAETGINSKSVVLDAGSGSGALCCFLANIVKRVYTYEIRDDFADIVRKNIEILGLRNVVLKKKDIYLGIDEQNLDLVALDLPEPWKVIPHAAALKHGGYLVSYSPSIPQVSDFVEAARSAGGLIYLRTIEVIQREWEFEQRKIRPKSQPIGHSGFLSFCRRL